MFGHRLIEGQGYVPFEFQADLELAGGLACGYVAVQLLYMAGLRVLYPTRAKGPLAAEAMSHLSALALVPYLWGVAVEWPHPALYRVEPLIYCGAFGAVHAFFKLVSFFASIRGAPSGRLAALGWALAGGVAVAGAYASCHSWLDEMRGDRPTVSEEANTYRVGDTYARARVMQEGALLHCPAPAQPGQCLTLRWANPPGLGPDEQPLTQVYVAVVFEGERTKPYTSAVTLDPAGWAESRVPDGRFRPTTRTCTVTWTVEREPDWRVMTGLRPTVTSHQRLLVSGPFVHEVRGGTSTPNVVLVAVEGLGADRLSCMGYRRETTPALDQLAYGAVIFPHAYTPAPEAAAAGMTLLTGLSPLRHGYLGAQRGPLPAPYRTLAEVFRDRYYVTAAFTEGEGHDDKDFVFGSGFERGFEVFNPSCHADRSDEEESDEGPGPPDARVTLEAAAAWVDAHADLSFLVFVRLRELRHPILCERYDAGYAKGKNPRPVDVYDSALRYVDGQLDAFLDHLPAPTCLIVTSLYGLDFTGGPRAAPERLLSEASLRVPLFLDVPGVKEGSRAGLVALEDVMPTFLDLAGIALDYPVDGLSFLKPPSTKEPVSMMGKPLVLSLRSDRWRFSWQSDQLPFAARSRSRGQPLELYDVAAAHKSGARQDRAAKHPELVSRYGEYLIRYLDELAKDWPTGP